MAAPTYYTADLVRALPDDGNRYEVVHGELLVTPAPRALHQLVVQRLAMALGLYLATHRIGQLFASPADISWGPDILVQPDLFVVDLTEARTLDWSRMRRLLLAIEVLSPTTARADRFTKRRLYQDVDVGTYWIVDADAQQAEVWTPDLAFPAIEGDRLIWRPAEAPAPFVIQLAELFRAI